MALLLLLHTRDGRSHVINAAAAAHTQLLGPVVNAYITSHLSRLPELLKELHEAPPRAVHDPPCPGQFMTPLALRGKRPQSRGQTGVCCDQDQQDASLQKTVSTDTF